MQYIIIAYDGSDKEALERRLKARSEHILLGDKMKKQGKALYGVALLTDDNQMKGSVYIVDFSSREELDKWLEIEPYMTGNVWKDIEIIPCKVGPSFLDK